MPDENDDLFDEDGNEALEDFNRLTDLLFQCHSACNIDPLIGGSASKIDPLQVGLLRCLLCNEAGGRGC